MTTCKHCGARLSRPPQARQSRCLDWLVTRCYFQPFFVYHSKCLKTIAMADFQQICHPHILPKSLNFSVTASSTMDILGASRIVVERDNGYRWVTECTLTANNIPAMQTSNATQYSASIPYEPIDPNAHYRAVVTFYAKDSSGSSTVQATTK